MYTCDFKEALKSVKSNSNERKVFTWSLYQQFKMVLVHSWQKTY